MLSSSAQYANDVIAALRTDEECPVVVTPLVAYCAALAQKGRSPARPYGRLTSRRYADALASCLHKCLPCHPTGGNSVDKRNELYTLLTTVRPLNARILNKLRLQLFPGIDGEVQRIEREIGLE